VGDLRLPCAKMPEHNIDTDVQIHSSIEINSPQDELLTEMSGLCRKDLGSHKLMSVISSSA
jgi:hypothetical protein